MDGKGDLPALVAAAVAGRTLTEVARASGVSVSTVQRRLRDPDVVEAVRDAKSQQRQERLGQLSELSARSIRRLGELVDDDHPLVALRAITLVLTAVLKLDTVVDTDERLAALEAAADQTGDPDD